MLHLETTRTGLTWWLWAFTLRRNKVSQVCQLWWDRDHPCVPVIRVQNSAPSLKSFSKTYSSSCFFFFFKWGISPYLNKWHRTRLGQLEKNMLLVQVSPSVSLLRKKKNKKDISHVHTPYHHTLTRAHGFLDILWLNTTWFREVPDGLDVPFCTAQPSGITVTSELTGHRDHRVVK